jgi:hypothetical protein
MSTLFIYRLSLNKEKVIMKDFLKEFQLICDDIGDLENIIQSENVKKIKLSDGYHIKYSMKLKDIIQFIETFNTHLYFVDDIPSDMETFITQSNLSDQDITIQFINKNYNYYSNNHGNNNYSNNYGNNNYSNYHQNTNNCAYPTTSYSYGNSTSNQDWVTTESPDNEYDSDEQSNLYTLFDDDGQYNCDATDYNNSFQVNTSHDYDNYYNYGIPDEPDAPADTSEESNGALLASDENEFVNYNSAQYYNYNAESHKDSHLEEYSEYNFLD